MHHILFSFPNYHNLMSRMEIWFEMSDSIRDTYQEILRQKLRGTEKIVEHSWRYPTIAHMLKF